MEGTCPTTLAAIRPSPSSTTVEGMVRGDRVPWNCSSAWPVGRVERAVRHAEVAHEALGLLRGAVADVDAHEARPVAELLRRGHEVGRLGPAVHAPRAPDHDHGRLAVQVGEVEGLPSRSLPLSCTGWSRSAASTSRTDPSPVT